MRRFLQTCFAAVLAAAFAAVVVNAASIPIFVGPSQTGGTIAFRPDLIPDLNQLVNQINTNVTPQSMATYQNFRNVLDNGEMIIQQRTASGSAPTGITNTATYWLDRWAGFGTSGSSLSIAATSSSSTPAVPAPFQAGMRVQRASSNANLSQLCAVQEIPTKDTLQLAGQNVVFSAFIADGANFSATGNSVIMAIVSGTGTDQGLATLISPNWLGQTNVVSSSVTTSTTYTRYSVTGVVPASASELAVELCFVPTGTAGTNDFFDFTGAQLEQGTVASQYEHRPLFVEKEKAYAYAYFLAEPGNGLPAGNGMVAGTNIEIATIPLPVPMRTTPTLTQSVGTFKLNIAGTPTTPTSFTATGVSQSTTMGEVSSSTTATSGQAIILQGAGGTGALLWSADF